MIAKSRKNLRNAYKHRVVILLTFNNLLLLRAFVKLPVAKVGNILFSVNMEAGVRGVSGGRWKDQAGWRHVGGVIISRKVPQSADSVS